jgi:hypothetical protein
MSSDAKELVARAKLPDSGTLGQNRAANSFVKKLSAQLFSREKYDHVDGEDRVDGESVDRAMALRLNTKPMSVPLNDSLGRPLDSNQRNPTVCG